MEVDGSIVARVHVVALYGAIPLNTSNTARWSLKQPTIQTLA